MHMADALISPPVGATFCAVTGGMIIYSAKKLKKESDEKKIPLMGVLGAFVFAAQMVNFTIPGTGSSGHLVGGMILAILLGPNAGFLTLASVLVIQALFFGDGGLLALGCNIFNMGFWTCFFAYPLIYRRMAKKDSTPGRLTLAAVVSVMVATQLGPFGIVIQTVVSGISELPFGSFLILIQPIHLAIGLVEGIVTAAFCAFVRKARPEILEASVTAKPLARVSIGKVLVGIAIAALLTGGVLSWYASTYPDGLEWSIKKIYGKSEIPGPSEGVVQRLENVQEKTAILPDYGFRSDEPTPPGEPSVGGVEKEDAWPAVSSGTTSAGIVGTVMTLGLAVLIGFILKGRKKV